MIGDLLEDLIFRDLGSLGGLWHNWGFYGAPICIVLEVFALQHLFSSHEHGVFRDPDRGFTTLVTELKTPLVWPLFNSQTVHDPHLTAFVFTASATFGVFGVYGMLRWREQLDRETTVKVVPWQEATKQKHK